MSMLVQTLLLKHLLSSGLLTIYEKEKQLQSLSATLLKLNFKIEA